MRITSRGRITIPQRVRHGLGLEPGDDVEIVVRDGVAVIVPGHDQSARHIEVAAASAEDAAHGWDADPAAWVRDQRCAAPRRGG